MRRTLAIIAACIALLGPATPAATAAEADPMEIAGQVNYYWAKTFDENGKMYWGPTIIGVFGDRLTGCGFIDPFNFGPAAYCPADAKIYLSGLLFGVEDDALWYVALAHEWGHHIETLLGYPPEPSKESEQRTDCMAGAFLGDAVAEGYASRGTFNGMLYVMLLIGDPPGLPAELESHGTASERAAAFNTGYSDGIAGCNVGLS
ncbi:MAG: neutral zinc metallopeptidase [Chloroflexota bacterium]